MIDDLLPIVKQAWSIILSYYEGTYDLWTKTHGEDYVTTADTETEKFFRKNLLTILPWSQFLWEESSDTITDRSWYVRIVDPLDWTKNFVKKNWCFWTILWLCLNWEPILGVIHYPTIWKTLYAQTWKWTYLLDWNTPNRILLPDLPSRYVHDNDTTWFWSIARLWLQICLWTVYWAYRIHSHRHKRDTCGLEVILKEAWWDMLNHYWNSLDYTQEKLFWKWGVVLGNENLILTFY